MKPKLRVIIELAVEEGVRRGYMLAHKHNPNPTEESVVERISDAVMSQLYEYFTFDLEDF
jgi:hypothetical protein